MCFYTFLHLVFLLPYTTANYSYVKSCCGYNSFFLRFLTLVYCWLMDAGGLSAAPLPSSPPHLLPGTVSQPGVYHLVCVIGLWDISKEEFRGEPSPPRCSAQPPVCGTLCNFIHGAALPSQARCLCLPFPLYLLVPVQPIVTASCFYICAHWGSTKSHDSH